MSAWRALEALEKPLRLRKRQPVMDQAPSTARPTLGRWLRGLLPISALITLTLTLPTHPTIRFLETQSSLRGLSLSQCPQTGTLTLNSSYLAPVDLV